MLGKGIALTVLGTFFAYVIWDYIKGLKKEEWESRLEIELVELIQHELKGYRTGAINTYINIRTGEYKAIVDLVQLERNLQPTEYYRRLCMIAQEKLDNLVDAEINIVSKYPYKILCSLYLDGTFEQYIM